MARKKQEKKGLDLSQLVDWVTESDDLTIQSRQTSERSRDYYDSIQLDTNEINALRKRKQAPVVINRIKPKIDGLMGLERQNRTTAKAYPRTPKHEGGAHAATEAIRYVLDDNNYPSHRSAAWDTMLVEGTGGIEVIVKTVDDKKTGGYKIVTNQIPWDRIIYDPFSRKKDFADARYLGQFKWMDYDIALEEFPDAEDMLQDMFTASNTYDDKPRWVDSKRRRVRVVELYYLDAGVWTYACFTRGGFLKGPQASVYENEEGEKEHPYSFGSLFVTRDGDRYGHVKQLLDVQDEINKRRSKALHLMSVRQTFATKGAVEDVNVARNELAKPDGHLEVAYGEFGKDFGVLPTGDMAQAQFKLLEESKMEIDAVSYNSASSGKDMRNMSGVALRAREVAGQTEVAPMFDILKGMDIRVYRKIWNRIKQFWKKEMWLRVTDDERNLAFVGLNTPITKGEAVLKAAQEQGVPPEQLAMLQQQIAQDPSSSEIVDTSNAVADLDLDIVLADAPDTVTAQIEDFQTLGEMVKSGFPMPPLAVIEASPLNNKDRIIKMMKEQPQLPDEVKQQMQKIQEENQKLKEENQALKNDHQAEAAKMQMDAQSEQQKLAAETQRAQAELALKAQIQAAELQLERERTEAQIALERLKAEAQVQIQGLKLQVDQESQKQKLEFDKQCRMEDEAAKREEKVKEEEVSVVPNVVKAMEMLTANFMQALEKNQQALMEIVEKNAKPRHISIDGVRTNSDGMITAASATVQ